MRTPNAIPTAEAAPRVPSAAVRPDGWRIGWLVLAVIGMLLMCTALVGQARRRQALAHLWQVRGKLPFKPELIVRMNGMQAATDDERRLWLWEGDTPREIHLFSAKAAALAVDAENGRVYAGDALGRLSIFGAAITSTPLVRQMPGRIVNLAVLESGALAVCYGKSASGPDTFIAILNDPISGPIPAGVPLNFCAREIEAAGNAVWFATLNSRVGRIGADAQVSAMLVLEQRPIRLIAAATLKPAMYAVDRRGGFNAVNQDGSLAWRRQVSRDALTLGALQPASGDLLITNQRGALYLVNQHGGTIAKWQQRALAPVLALFAQADGFELVHKDGTLSVLAMPPRFAAAIPFHCWLWWSLFGVGLISTTTGGLLSHTRLSTSSRQLALAMFRQRIAYVLLLPTLGLLAVFCYWPAFSAFLYSFMQFSLSEPPHFIGIENFRTLTHDPYVWIGMRNLVILIVTGVFKTLTMPLLAAELVYWLSNDRFKQWMRTSFVLPTVVPGLIGIMLWKMIYQPEAGLLNETLRLLGLAQFARPWLGDEQLAIWAIVFAGFPWIGVFPFLIFLGGLINVPRDVFEAASVDGISVWQRFWRIDLPLIRPQIKLLLTFTFIGTIQEFTSVLVFTMGGPGNSTFVPALQMFLQTSQSTNLGYASAIGIFLFALVMLATGLNFALLRTERE